MTIISKVCNASTILIIIFISDNLCYQLFDYKDSFIYSRRTSLKSFDLIEKLVHKIF